MTKCIEEVKHVIVLVQAARQTLLLRKANISKEIDILLIIRGQPKSVIIPFVWYIEI